MSGKKFVNGILLLYYHPVGRGFAPTVMEHVESFEKYSAFKVWKVNTELGIPRNLFRLGFKIVIFHYSLFGREDFRLDKNILRYLDENPSYRIAFFQDEYQYCRRRFGFLNQYDIDCVYTLLEPPYSDEVYEKRTKVKKIIHNLTGYVGEDLLNAAERLARPDDLRSVDIGYRARELPCWMGKEAGEKASIGEEFKRRGENLGLVLDIETKESKRFHGDEWYRFMADCRGMLGVEAGVSIFDLEDKVRIEYEQIKRDYPGISEGEVALKMEQTLDEWEGRIYYRTISPRHFEAAAFRVCQILFEGNYSGILEPMVHYIPLKKDFSNFSEVIERFKDKAFRHQITENAYRDLIESGRYSYRNFIETFDGELLKEGFQPGIMESEILYVSEVLSRDQSARELYGFLKGLRYKPFPGREALVKLIKKMTERK